jgi:hypothetical protein
MGVSLCRGPLGNWGGVRFLGILRDIWRALEREHLSLWELCYRNLEGALFMGIQDMGRRAQGPDITLCGRPVGEFGRRLVYRGIEKALETGTFLHKDPVKNHGGLFTGNSEISEGGLYKQSISLYGRSLKGT